MNKPEPKRPPCDQVQALHERFDREAAARSGCASPAEAGDDPTIRPVARVVGMKLKPCPHCGEDTAWLHRALCDGPNDGPIAWAECTTCGARGGGRPTPIEAATAWNRRDGSPLAELSRDDLVAASRYVSSGYAATVADSFSRGSSPELKDLFRVVRVLAALNKATGGGDA